MRSIPTVTKNLLILNVIAYIAYEVMNRVSGLNLNTMFGLAYFETPFFHVYQLVTYMFMHAGVEHLFFNMFALWMFGCVVERAWGSQRFLVYYMVCGIGAGLLQEFAQMMSWHMWGAMPGLTVGASGAVYGVLLAFGMTWPEERIMIFPLPIPIKAKWFVCIYAALELFLAMHSSGDNVAHIAHLGGMLFGFLLIKFWQNGYSMTNYNIDQIVKKVKRENKTKAASEEKNADWDYNSKQKEKEEEIDRILDKVRRSGYDSLTKEEKKRLFQ